MGNLNLFLERYVALRTSMIEDGIVAGAPFASKDRQTLVERLTNEGSSFVLVTLPRLGKALDLALITGTFICPSDFRRKKGVRYPMFLGGLFSQIFTDQGILLAQPNVKSIMYLRQFLLFDSKLITEPSLEQKIQAKQAFILRQARLSQVRLPIDNPILLRAQKLLTQVLSRLNLDDITPGHGPGVVADGSDRIERWVFRSWPSRAERFYPFNIYGAQGFQALCSSGPPTMTSDSHSKCALVPKDFKGPRLISSESAATQYLQQGQMKALMHYVDHHYLLSKSIKLRDQTHNQKSCQRAYGDGLDTLDLSNASDSVSAALVWFLLSGNRKIRAQLFSTRSQFMKIDQSSIRLVAFSPMGSAVCFPIETLVFWALSLASVRHVQSGFEGSPSLLVSASSVSVFGDDIIIPSYATDTLISILTSVGCEVNMSKTCRFTPFRESCGSEWFNGTDITIIRNRDCHYDDVHNILNYPVLLDLQRKFFLRGFFRTAALLTNWASLSHPVVQLTVSSLPNWKRAVPLLNKLEDFFSSSEIARLCCKDLDLPSESSWFSLTTSPSGLGLGVSDLIPFDSFPVALGRHSTVIGPMKFRYNGNLHRLECRVPRFIQKTVDWDTISAPVPSSLSEKTSNRSECRKALETGYPRLLARVVGDVIDRIPIRSVKLKIGWLSIPGYWSFNQ